jgi:4-hydroxybenzoate polyprenyltransferase
MSTFFHSMTVILLFATAMITNLGWIAYAGIATVAGILYWEHRLVKPNDLSRINVAFFNLNGYISILLLLTFAGDILIR